jgi:hypothetical protein
MQVAAHHLNAQSPPGRRSAGGKSAISENQPLGRPHRPPLVLRPEDPKRERRTSASSGAQSAASACDASCQTPSRMRHNFSIFPRNQHKQMDFENAQNPSPLPANMRHNRPNGPRHAPPMPGPPPVLTQSKPAPPPDPVLPQAKPASQAKANLQRQSNQQELGSFVHFCPTRIPFPRAHAASTGSPNLWGRPHGLSLPRQETAAPRGPSHFQSPSAKAFTHPHCGHPQPPV